MNDDDIRVILNNLPTTVKGFVYTDSSGMPCVVLNARMPHEIQVEAYDHEVKHIQRGDMDNKDFREYAV